MCHLCRIIKMSYSQAGNNLSRSPNFVTQGEEIQVPPPGNFFWQSIANMQAITSILFCDTFGGSLLLTKKNFCIWKFFLLKLDLFQERRVRIEMSKNKFWEKIESGNNFQKITKFSVPPNHRLEGAPDRIFG